MDINHDYDGTNAFLVSGTIQRLQAVKSAILSFGDMGYTDPTVPDVREIVGEYTDADGAAKVESMIYNIIVESFTATPEEIISIKAVNPIGDTKFTVQLNFTFGKEVIDVSSIL